MELGRYLVDENLGERNNDTLSRWLLHAIAEHLAACGTATNSAQKKRESETADLILRLWKHRAVVPMDIDPLAPYERVCKAFRSLLPQANPWQFRDESSANETVAAELYRCLSLLTVSMFLLSVEAIPKRSRSEKTLHDSFLPVSENSILLLFEQVAEFVAPKLNSDSKHAASKTPKTTLSDAAQGVRSLIERTRTALNEALVIVDRAERGGSRRKVVDLHVSAQPRLKALAPGKKALSNSKSKNSPSARLGKKGKQKR